MTTRPADDLPTQPLPEQSGPDLEQAFIRTYLREKGHTLESLHGLPENEVKRLMTEASAYASIHMAEIEARARFRQELHDAYASSENK